MAAGLAGALFAPITAFVSPSSFPFFQSILFLLVVIVGGSGTVLRPPGRGRRGRAAARVPVGVAEYRLLFFGGLLLVVMWLAPGRHRRSGRARLPRPAEHQGRVTPDADHGAGAVEAFLSERGRRRTSWSCRIWRSTFGGLQAVEGLSFVAEPGKVTSLHRPERRGQDHGPEHDRGLLQAERGRVRVRDVDLAGRPSHLVSRAGIARTYQTTQLFGDLTVRENILIALQKGRLGGLKSALSHVRSDAGALARTRMLCWISSATRDRPACWPRTSPMSTGGSSRSPARWRPSRACCCWTSRRPD